MVRQHRILGLIVDDRLKWRVHLKDVKARAKKKLGLLKTLAHKKWGRDRETLLRIHQMIVLSILRLEESIYKRATKPALEPIHNKGVKLALGVFAICKTENTLCEAGLPTLSEMRELNTTIVATRVLMNERHPIRHLFTNCRTQDEHAMRKGTPSPIFMKTIDKFGELGVDTRKV
jgi:hypothetical protein